MQLIYAFTVCPNPACKQYTLRVGVHSARQVQTASAYTSDTFKRSEGPVAKAWRLVPPSFAQVWPEYVPAPIRSDYEEACAIRDPSPKASATLARRCLQGMIRDFHADTVKDLTE